MRRGKRQIITASATTKFNEAHASTRLANCVVTPKYRVLKVGNDMYASRFNATLSAGGWIGFWWQWKIMVVILEGYEKLDVGYDLWVQLNFCVCNYRSTNPTEYQGIIWYGDRCNPDAPHWPFILWRSIKFMWVFILCWLGLHYA